MDNDLNEILKMLDSRILSTEIIVNQLFDTLVEKGIIDEDEFQESIDIKVAKINKIAKEYIEEDENDMHKDWGNLFNGPIGEA